MAASLAFEAAALGNEPMLDAPALRAHGLTLMSPASGAA
jgi:hypothetical protein